QRDGEAEELAPVADSSQAVLVPAVGARTGVVVREVVPGGSVRAVVLAHRAPGALGEIRSPALPVLLALARFLQPRLFGGHRHPPESSLEVAQPPRAHSGYSVIPPSTY